MPTDRDFARFLANSDKDPTQDRCASSVWGALRLAWSLVLVACTGGAADEQRSSPDEDEVTQEAPSSPTDADGGLDAPTTARADGATRTARADGAVADAARGAFEAGAGASREPAVDAGASALPERDASPAPSTDGAAKPPSSSSALPPLADPGAKGPFAIDVEENLDGLATHILIAPKDLGKDGIKHPIVVWVNGAGANSSSYRALLDNVAAHGFFLLDDKQSTFEVPPEVQAQRAAIDWAIAQNEKQGGPYFGKLDSTRIAIAGHSLGSVSTFGNVGDARIKTSLHMAGGLLGNPQGVDEGWMKGLHVPAAFLCGDRDSNGIGRVRRDFAGAPPNVPVYFGLLAGAGHTDEFNKENGGRWGRVVIAWLRWQLAGDESFAKFFQGAECEFCKGDWMAMKRNID